MTTIIVDAKAMPEHNGAIVVRENAEQIHAALEKENIGGTFIPLTHAGSGLRIYVAVDYIVVVVAGEWP